MINKLKCTLSRIVPWPILKGYGFTTSDHALSKDLVDGIDAPVSGTYTTRDGVPVDVLGTTRTAAGDVYYRVQHLDSEDVITVNEVWFDRLFKSVKGAA